MTSPENKRHFLVLGGKMTREDVPEPRGRVVTQHYGESDKEHARRVLDVEEARQDLWRRHAKAVGLHARVLEAMWDVLSGR